MWYNHTEKSSLYLLLLAPLQLLLPSSNSLLSFPWSMPCRRYPLVQRVLRLLCLWIYRKTSVEHYFHFHHELVCLAFSFCTDKITCHLLAAGGGEARVVTCQVLVPFSLITASETECVPLISFSPVMLDTGDGLLLQMSFLWGLIVHAVWISDSLGCSWNSCL